MLKDKVVSALPCFWFWVLDLCFFTSKIWVFKLLLAFWLLPLWMLWWSWKISVRTFLQRPGNFNFNSQKVLLFSFSWAGPETSSICWVNSDFHLAGSKLWAMFMLGSSSAYGYKEDFMVFFLDGSWCGLIENLPELPVLFHCEMHLNLLHEVIKNLLAGFSV